jgi:hypothetical protein
MFDSNGEYASMRQVDEDVVAARRVLSPGVKLEVRGAGSSKRDEDIRHHNELVKLRDRNAPRLPPSLVRRWRQAATPSAMGA